MADHPRGKILRLPTDGSVALAGATVIVPEDDAVMEGFAATASHLYLSEMVGGPSRKGPLVASLAVESEAPGCNKLVREIRMIACLEHPGRTARQN